jgi:IS30 family transposase
MLQFNLIISLELYRYITLKYIQMIEDKLNNRPRKFLNCKTPNEVFYTEKIVA